MKKKQIYKIAWKGISFFAFPAGVFWVLAVFFGVIAWKNGAGMCEEKQEPFQIQVTSENVDTDDIGRIEEIGQVLSATLVYEVPCTMQMRGGSAEVMLQGIDRTFVYGGTAQSFLQGTVYEDETGMPYIVANESALKQFVRNEEDDSAEAVAEIDWTREPVTLMVGEKKLVAKLCGVLANGDESEEPKLFISRSSARSLLAQGNLTNSCTTAWIRIKNAGAQEAVETRLLSYGYQAENIDEEKVRAWELTRSKITGEIIAAVISLLAFLCMIYDRMKRDQLVNQTLYRELQELYGTKDIRRRLNAYRVVGICAVGALLAWVFTSFSILQV
ncbi:MAG: hypothetical protein IJ567_04780 [Lachnospiraceae bacterium]|nr:hypothetical protein [Lachnospiraceae bacterium]